jgi:hypothetical protein
VFSCRRSHSHHSPQLLAMECTLNARWWDPLRESDRQKWLTRFWTRYHGTGS